jgi:hypothetical protein
MLWSFFFRVKNCSFSNLIEYYISDINFDYNPIKMKAIVNTERITIQEILMNKRVYHIINIAFGSIILGIFLYSIIFRGNNHPIPALLTQITGIIPPSKGLSASFSEIVRGNFNAAFLLNPYGLRIFSFFVIQLFTRVLVSIAIEGEWVRFSRIVVIDSLYSMMLFGICFAPLIGYTIHLFSKFL